MLLQKRRVWLTEIVVLLSVLFLIGSGPARAALISSSVATDTALSGFSLTIGPGSVRIPITRNVTGLVTADGLAGLDPITANKFALAPPPGIILNVGPPPAGGVVSIPVTTVTNTIFGSTMTASAGASIRGTPTGPGGGVINQVSIVASTPTAASVTGFVGGAAAAAEARTDPIVLDPLAEDSPALLTVDLASSFPSDPAAAFRLVALSSDPAAASAAASFSVHALTNLPGLSSLFDLTFAANGASNAVAVAFSSPVMSQPIFSSDFDTPTAGVYVLKAGKKVFSVPFTIPAGSFGSDSSGPFGLSLDLVEDTSTRTTLVPAPASSALLVTGLIALIALRGRRRSPGLS